MSPWTAFPYPSPDFEYSLPALRQRWARLHVGDQEPWPEDEAVQAAWAACHAGRFEQAVQAGLAAGGAGLTVANRAQAIYAHYLEPSVARQRQLLQQVAERAQAQVQADPSRVNGWYLLAYALGRQAQALSIPQALAQGLGTRIRQALQETLRLSPQHADAHIALGTYHAEVIDKVGKLLGKTQGADADTGLHLFRVALQLHPASAIARVEYARGLLMLEGEKRLADSERLYQEATACEPADAIERLDQLAAQGELDDAS